MAWWSWRSGDTGRSETKARTKVPPAEGGVRVGPPAPRMPECDCVSTARPAFDEPPPVVVPVTLERVGAALDRIGVRYLADGDGNLLAMWERHAVLFTLEGPEDEILVVRARPHATVPPIWADRAYQVVNEWNHTRRFCKAYVGDPTERGQLPIYAEVQVPLQSGVHDALLAEILECGTTVALSFVDWLYDEGALL